MQEDNKKNDNIMQSDELTGKKTKQKDPKPPAPENEPLQDITADKEKTPIGEIDQLPKKCAYMYLGPNIPGGLLFKGSLYRGDIPEHLGNVLEKLPEIKELFVEVREVPQFKRDLEVQGTEANRLYGVVIVKINEGVLKDVGV